MRFHWRTVRHHRVRPRLTHNSSPHSWRARTRITKLNDIRPPSSYLRLGLLLKSSDVLLKKELNGPEDEGGDSVNELIERRTLCIRGDLERAPERGRSHC